MPTTKNSDQQIAWIIATFEGLQKNDFTGVIKVHMHNGGIRGARKEETIDIDWYSRA